MCVLTLCFMPDFANHKVSIKVMKICLQIEANKWHFKLIDSITLNWNAVDPLMNGIAGGVLIVWYFQIVCMCVCVCVCVCVCQTDTYM